MADLVPMSTLKMKDESGNDVTFEVIDAKARSEMAALGERIEDVETDVGNIDTLLNAI